MEEKIETNITFLDVTGFHAISSEIPLVWNTKLNTIYIDIKLKLKIGSQLYTSSMDCQNQALNPQPSQGQQTIKKIQHYLFNWSSLIGKGSFSEVYLGVNQKNQEQVAIKMIKNESVKSKTAQRLLNHEINILKYLDHPNVIKSHDVFSSMNNCYIITEYCQGGDLEKLLKQKKVFAEQQITKIVYDIYKGLQYLNENFIIHRDFKIANIFLKNGTYKIADFGFAIRSKTFFADIPVGSPIYMSPEGLITNNYGPKTDVWSFGIMLYQILHGQAPLDKCRSEQELKLNVVKKPKISSKLSKQLTDLIQLCMEPNHSKRISIAEIKETLYMKKVFSTFQDSIIVPQKLVSTFHSTETSSSTTIDSLFERNFSFQEALSILHYCRFLHKTSLRTKCKAFQVWLLVIFQGFSKCNVSKSPQKSPKNQNPKSQYQNLKQVIHQYHQKYMKQHTCKRLNLKQSSSFDSILSECTKLYKQYQGNSEMNELKSIVFRLYKETQLLNQSFKTNKMDYFSKHSQSRDFLSTLSKMPLK